MHNMHSMSMSTPLRSPAGAILCQAPPWASFKGSQVTIAAVEERLLSNHLSRAPHPGIRSGGQRTTARSKGAWVRVDSPVAASTKHACITCAACPCPCRSPRLRAPSVVYLPSVSPIPNTSQNPTLIRYNCSDSAFSPVLQSQQHRYFQHWGIVTQFPNST